MRGYPKSKFGTGTEKMPDTDHIFDDSHERYLERKLGDSPDRTEGSRSSSSMSVTSSPDRRAPPTRTDSPRRSWLPRGRRLPCRPSSAS